MTAQQLTDLREEYFEQLRKCAQAAVDYPLPITVNALAEHACALMDFAGEMSDVLNKRGKQ